MDKVNFSRRNFFKTVAAIAVATTIGVWDKIVKTELASTVKKNIKFPFNRNKEIAFVENFIVVNEPESTHVYSAHCTHLGCEINEFKEGKFVCPCHGSEYSKSGDVLRGPAYKPLEQVTYHFDKNKEFIFVES